jgi:hypothetical protein
LIEARPGLAIVLYALAEAWQGVEVFSGITAHHGFLRWHEISGKGGEGNFII